MAVLQPGAFQGIYEMLKQRADQAQNAPPSPLAMAANVAGKAGAAYVGTKVANSLENDQTNTQMDQKVAHEKDLEIFRNKLQMDLDSNKEKHKLAAEGKSLRTNEDLKKYYESHGLDPKYAPSLPEEGIYLSDADVQNKFKHAQFQTELQKEAETLLASKDPADQKRGKFLHVASFLPDEKLDSIVDDLRKVMVPESEPKPGGRSSSLLDPRRRTDELSNQFKKEVKDINFLKYEDAYGVANRARKVTPTSASDTRLLYAYAKMLQPTGVLTDQDFKTSVNNGSYGEEATRILNKPGEGNVLSPSFRKKIIDEISAQYKKNGEQLKGIEEHYTMRAEEEDLKPKDIVRNVRTVERIIQEDNEAEKLLRDAGKKITEESLDVAKKILKKRKESAKK